MSRNIVQVCVFFVLCVESPYKMNRLPSYNILQWTKSSRRASSKCFFLRKACGSSPWTLTTSDHFRTERFFAFGLVWKLVIKKLLAVVMYNNIGADLVMFNTTAPAAVYWSSNCSLLYTENICCRTVLLMWSHPPVYRKES